MRERPFAEEKVGENRFLRQFSASDADEMVWHRDQEDRRICLRRGAGWMLQLDDELPRPLYLDEWHHIPAEVWHRLIVAGTDATDATIEVVKLQERTNG